MLRARRSSPRFVSFAIVLGCCFATAAASAQQPVPGVLEEDDATVPRVPVQKERPFFVGASLGIGYVTAEHPAIIASRFPAATFNAVAGVAISDRLTIGVEVTSVERGVSRSSTLEPFHVNGSTPLAGCNNCTPPPPGADPISTTFVFGTLAPRIEYTPFGKDGLYLSASAGYAFVVSLDGRNGFGATGRLGYRFRVSPIMAFSVEGAFQGQYYGDASAYLPFLTATFRPNF